MSVVPEAVPMAECLNFGLGLADNDDLRQHIMQPGPVFREFLRYMDYRSPSRKKKDVVLSVNPKNNEQNSEAQSNMSNSTREHEDKLAEYSFEDSDIEEETKTKKVNLKKPEVPSSENTLYFLPVNYNKRNPWRRTIGLHVYGHELRSATYPARSSVKKLRFAQAKKPLNYLYSYFSVELLDCDDISSITIGICRKDYPSKVCPGKNSGSVGYNSDTGAVSIYDSSLLDGPRFSKGDIIGCGIIYPSHYRRYADLSTDDNSDGMTDVVLSSLLNTNSKSMNFVCSVLNLNNADRESNSDSEVASNDQRILSEATNTEESEYFNDNFVESRTPVEVYFTRNMKVVGKVLSYVPVGGYYPTVHVYSTSAIKMNVDLNPPAS